MPENTQRQGFIGGSDAVQIMNGQAAAVWKRKTGRADEPDLSGILPAVMGHYTEPLNRMWFTRKVGLFVLDPARNDDGTFRTERHPTARYIACHPDGMVREADGTLALFEAKHVSERQNIHDAIDDYYWQLIHNSLVVGTSVAYLSVLFGNIAWDYARIDINVDEQVKLLNEELRIWKCIEDDIEPVDQNATRRRVDVTTMVETDMTGNNAWAAAAADFITSKPYVDLFEGSKNELKNFIPDGSRRAHGHGVEVVRSRANSITVRIMKP